jgi:hypothetical protein
MIRMLISTAIHFAANAIGLVVAAWCSTTCRSTEWRSLSHW